MAAERFLVDTSAIVRKLSDPAVFDRWRDAVARGLICITEATQIEFLYSARSAKDHARLTSMLERTYIKLDLPVRAWRRALQVQTEMVARGTHRSAGLADLIVAATAEEYRLTVLHDDKDFDCIAAVTGQPVRRVLD
ncbi:PIN domain nuclease [uncultured Thermomonospora sp.]|uniref:PIN domain nuclease n=1 Tax=uncultured Thermomonospora sp. TaxID=671175 RepID=UPI00259BCDC0|nr:PIN domain nuclease [uncultured Thermomonospora sp.]